MAQRSLLSLDESRSFAKLSLDTRSGKKINREVNGARLEGTNFLRGPHRDAESKVNIRQSCDNVLPFLLYAKAVEIIMPLISKSF